MLFYLPFTTGDSPTFGIFGSKPINDKFSLEGFYFKQFLEGDDFHWGELQTNYLINKDLEAFVTGVFVSDKNYARAGLRLK